MHKHTHNPTQAHIYADSYADKYATSQKFIGSKTNIVSGERTRMESRKGINTPTLKQTDEAIRNTHINTNTISHGYGSIQTNTNR